MKKRPTTKEHRSARRSGPSNSVFILVAALHTLSGCVTVLSPEELARQERHDYPGRSKAQVYRATATSLRTLGYDIVVSSETEGQLKTAPKRVTAVAHGSGYTAVATENAIAWNVAVKSSDRGAALHAEPRGYSGGQSVPTSRMNGDYLRRLFATLYGEIDNNLQP